MEDEDLKKLLGEVGSIAFYLQKTSNALERIADSLEHLKDGAYKGIIDELKELEKVVKISNPPKEMKKITEKQKKFLEKNGVEVSDDMSREEASRLIKNIINKNK